MTAQRSRRTIARQRAGAGVETAQASIARTCGNVWCGRRLARALISVVERRGETSSLRYVQWCSLAGIDLDCDEHCLANLDAGAAEERRDTGGSPTADQGPQTPNQPARSPGQRKRK